MNASRQRCWADDIPSSWTRALARSRSETRVHASMHSDDHAPSRSTGLSEDEQASDRAQRTGEEGSYTRGRPPARWDTTE